MKVIAIDNIRGIAFIFMIIHHIFYFYDLSNNYTTKLSKNILVSSSGEIARILFILTAGICIGLSATKNGNIKKRLERSLIIGLHALIIGLITYIYYPDYYIRFGILHFLALSTLLISFIAPYKKLSVVILLISFFIKPPIINSLIDTITGAKQHYNMMDYFPLFPWIQLILTGLIISQYLNIKSLDTIPYLSSTNILTLIGRNSLELYTGHIILLIYIYSLKK